MRKKLLNMLILVVGVSTLVGCSSGSTDETTQDYNVTYFLGSEDVTGVYYYKISGIATNCHIIKINGTCTVNITYTGTGTYSGPVTFISNTSVVGLPSGYSSNLSSVCPDATGTPNSCTITIAENITPAMSSSFISFAFDGNRLNTTLGFALGGL
jgi:hypothetical protein